MNPTRLPSLHDEQRHYDGYRRPSRIGLILTLLLILAGTVWIDLYDVPYGLRSLACDFRVTGWHGILTSPKLYFGAPVLLAELAFAIRLVVWIWPSPALAQPTLSDWVLILVVSALAVGLLLYQLAALQPAPWHACVR